MVLSCQNIGKSFGEESILSQVSFQLEEGEKAALVGPNGAGKTTLLRILTGHLEADEGTVALAKGKTLGYLSQIQKVEGGRTVYEEVKSARAQVFALEEQIRQVEASLGTLTGQAQQEQLELYHQLSSQYEQENGFAAASQIAGVLKGLGFQEKDFDKKVDTLSGGEKTRVALSRLLLEGPSILLLDEPTNHLDLEATAWLETFLGNYPGTVLIVSHDRYFLDRIVTKVLDLDGGRLRTYLGNFSAYADKKRKLREDQLKAYLKQQEEIRHQEAVIEKLRSFNREKSIKRAESRKKALGKMQRLEKPASTQEGMQLTLSPALQSGQDVLRVEHVQKTFGERILLRDVTFNLHRGEHVALIGANGTGKTTFLQILNQALPASAGTFLLGAKVEMGYYDQEHQLLHPDFSILQEMQDAYPDLTDTRIRNTLAAFQFTGEDVYKEIRSLSGGERGRVSLAKLMLSKANFLILDEPTNHLDMLSKEILEDALNHYQGTLLYVSHDRYFINRTAGRILELYRGTFLEFPGNYDYYLEKREAVRNAAFPQEASASSLAPGEASVQEKGPAKLDWQAQKEQRARRQKQRNALEKTEAEIASLELHLEELQHALSKEEVYLDPEKCQQLAGEKDQTEERLQSLYEAWETLAQAQEESL